MSDSRQQLSSSGAMLIATVIAVAIGLMTLLGFVPTIQSDTLPPECSAAFGNVVACGSQGVAVGLALAAALVSGVLSSVVVRRMNQPLLTGTPESTVRQ